MKCVVSTRLPCSLDTFVNCLLQSDLLIFVVQDPCNQVQGFSHWPGEVVVQEQSNGPEITRKNVLSHSRKDLSYIL